MTQIWVLYRQSDSDRLEKSAAAEPPATYLLFRREDTNAVIRNKDGPRLHLRDHLLVEPH